MEKFFQGMMLPLVWTYQGGKGAYKGAKWVHGKFKKRKPIYGNAAWASAKELEREGYFDHKGFALGRIEGRNIYAHPHSSLMMFGHPGAGKTSTMGATLHRARGEHLVVLDSPGWLLKRFRRDLERKGYHVVAINLNEPLRGVSYDPFDYFRDSDEYSFESDMDTLARLVCMDAPLAMGADKHFTEISFGMVGGLSAYFQQFDPQRASLAAVADVLTTMGKLEMEQLLGDVSLSACEYARKGINAYHRQGKDEHGSTDSTNSRKVRDWNTRSYKDLTRKGGLVWDDVWLASKPVAVFVTGGVGSRDKYAAFLRVFFGQCSGSLSRFYTRHQARVPRGVKIMVDEAPLLGRCEPLVDAVAELRKVGVTVFLGYQDIHQVRSRMGNDLAHTLLGNSARIVTGGSTDIAEYKPIAEAIGKRTEWATSKNKGGDSQSEAGTFVMNPDEIRRLPLGKFVVLSRHLSIQCDAPFKYHKDEPIY